MDIIPMDMIKGCHGFTCNRLTVNQPKEIDEKIDVKKLLRNCSIVFNIKF